ncbi:MAG TPA: hypothetical protein VLX85_14175 [Stellaceae bacterium]|nr:hypothetical protein [Stellaceae bacterium]
MMRFLGIIAALGLMLLGCSAAPPTSLGPGWPRNADGIPVDLHYGTPLPGRPPIY